MVVNLVFQYHPRAPIQGDDACPTFHHTVFRAKPVGLVIAAVVPEKRISAHYQLWATFAARLQAQIERKLVLYAYLFILFVVVCRSIFILSVRSGAQFRFHAVHFWLMCATAILLFTIMGI